MVSQARRRRRGRLVTTALAVFVMLVASVPVASEARAENGDWPWDIDEPIDQTVHDAIDAGDELEQEFHTRLETDRRVEDLEDALGLSLPGRVDLFPLLRETYRDGIHPGPEAGPFLDWIENPHQCFTGDEWTATEPLFPGERCQPERAHTTTAAPTHPNFQPAVASDPAGKTALVAGHARDSGNQIDVLLGAYDTTSGATRWERTWGEPTHDEVVFDIAVSGEGEALYVAMGTRDAATDEYDVALAAFRMSDGTELWRRNWNFGDHEWATGLVFTPSAIVVTAVSRREATSYDIVVTAASPDDGSERWHQVVDHVGEADQPFDLALTPGGDAVAVAMGLGIPNPEGHVGIIALPEVRAYRLDTGDQMWATSLGEHGVGGIDLTSSPHGVGVSTRTFPDPQLVVLDDAGAVTWARRPTIGSTMVLPRPDGGVIVAGTGNSGPQHADLAVRRYDAEGSLVARGDYDGPEHLDDFASVAAYDPVHDRVVVSGPSWGVTDCVDASFPGPITVVCQGYRWDMATVSFSLDGEQQWVARHPVSGAGPWAYSVTSAVGNTDDLVDGMAIAESGRIVVAGRTPSLDGIRIAIAVYDPEPAAP